MEFLFISQSFSLYPFIRNFTNGTFTLSLLLCVDFIIIESLGKKLEKLDCSHEEHKPFDWFAVKTVISDGMIVGHLSKEILWITKFFLSRGAVMQVQLTSKHYRHYPLVYEWNGNCLLSKSKDSSNIKRYQTRRKILRFCQREVHQAKE